MSSWTKVGDKLFGTHQNKLSHTFSSRKNQNDKNLKASGV